ncbi:MAG: hypothetical protein P8020_15725 [Acidobacteriota bacterium]
MSSSAAVLMPTRRRGTGRGECEHGGFAWNRFLRSLVGGRRLDEPPFVSAHETAAGMFSMPAIRGHRWLARSGRQKVKRR